MSADDPGQPQESLGPSEPEHWDLTLYVFKGSIQSRQAMSTLRRICQEELGDRVSLRMVDIHEHPEALERDNILAIPTLLRREPAPVRRIVGDLSDRETLRASLLLPPEPETARRPGRRHA
ncbi:circadian clock protein KaiB [Synechococcus sp. RSCCF101]|uniref:circadian clock KaiB family protein n=1 Tax=Synechococcus sp. RSCCF101 TaxID=2511069 RepID=UPI001248812B|nr:circadian clock KaiB family protein [Synechococcus sp. RSCCF101]QEY32502.1 circadian clock protein KaiB [Synechococcus sp. RSCCF101]